MWRFGLVLWVAALATGAAPALALNPPGDAPTDGGGSRACEPGPTWTATRPGISGLPLFFEENAGQVDDSVRYFARSRGLVLAVTREAGLLALLWPEPGSGPAEGDAGQPVSALASPVLLRADLVGAGRLVRVAGEHPLAARVSYFKGDRTDRWRTGLSTYGAVRCADVYPGVDLVVYGTPRGLELDFEVAPGGDPGAIALEFSSPDGAAVERRLTADGSLLLEASGATLELGAPAVYQEIGGMRRPVAGRLRIRADGQLRFAIGDHERTAALVIDPTLQAATLLGGSNRDAGYAVAVDDAGNVYLVGSTTSVDFPVTSGAVDGSLSGSSDAFVARLTPQGDSLGYLTFFGGGGIDHGYAVAVDATGRAVIAGTTRSDDLPTTPGAFQATRQGLQDGFVARLGPQGDHLDTATYLGGGDDDWMFGVALDAAGAIYVAGHAHTVVGAGFPVTPGAYRTIPRGTTDATVTKLAPDGRHMVYSTYLGGLGSDSAYGIALDRQGSAYVTGWVTTNSGFVSKLTPDGGSLAYSRTFSGGGVYSGVSVAVDDTSHAYVLVVTTSPSFPTTEGALARHAPGGADLVVIKLDPTGQELMYATYLGGSGAEWNLDNDGHTPTDLALALGPGGSAWVVGSTRSADFPTTPDALSRSLFGVQDAFVVRLNSTGTGLEYGTYLGGGDSDAADGVAAGLAGSAWVVGVTSSSDFPTGPGSASFGTTGASDVFAARFGDETCVSDVPSYGYAGLGVTFNGPSTLADGSAVTAYVWDFGDGSATSTQQGPSHVYASPASYPWRLRSTSSTGACSAAGVIDIEPTWRRGPRRLAPEPGMPD